MPLDIRSEDVDRLADHLASLARMSKTEAVRTALVNEIARREAPLWQRIQPLLDEIEAIPDTGLEADKAFYDGLNGEA